MKTKFAPAIDWRTLKEFVNQLPEGVLDKPVLLSGVDEGWRIQEASLFDEDQRLGEEGYAPESDFKASLNEGESLDDYPIAHRKGDPMLFTGIEIEDDQTTHPSSSGEE
jgi:hypothetical protein